MAPFDTFPMFFSAVFGALCMASLWCTVGAIGFFGVPRTHSQARLTLLGAGLLGALLSIGGPTVFAVIGSTVTNIVGFESALMVHGLLNSGLTLLWLGPWGLLLLGLWRVARGLAAAVEDG
ncbi:MAG: hypothetical protein AB8H79_20345 [Myxococcota bacterium]